MCVSGKARYVHRISACLYLGFDDSPDYVICHHCDNPPCFNPEHLFIGTISDNMLDAVAKGRKPAPDVRGTKNPKARLNEDDVREIKRLLKNGWTLQNVAKFFDVHKSTITHIKMGRHWPHVEEPKTLPEWSAGYFIFDGEGNVIPRAG